MKTVTLFRPVGLKELELIALEWNTRDSFSGFLGAVTAFVLLG